MKILISPAKRMCTHTEFPQPKSIPTLLDYSKKLLEYIQTLSYQELKDLLRCNESLVRENYIRFRSMILDENLLYTGNSALVSYDGIQYKYMAPHVFEDRYFDYVQTHLRILSGFYGILKPLDAVLPYRLEMQAKLQTDFCNNLYDFWKDSLYRELIRDEVNKVVIVNLASVEYSKTITPWLSSADQFVSCVFGQLESGKIKEKGVYVKMARGEMVRFMAENNIENITELSRFDRLGFSYAENLSSDTVFVFLRNDFS